MDSGQITAVLIVAIVMIASIIRSRAKMQLRNCRSGRGDSVTENQRLRDEVSSLKERLKVLERIAVDKENSLAKEIEALRDS